MIARGVKFLAAALAISILLLLVASGALAWWVLHTGSGSGWAWQRIRAAVPGELAAAAVSGTFAGGLEVSGLSYAAPAVRVRAARVRLALDPDLFPPALAVSVVDAAQVEVRLTPSPAPPEPGPPFSLSSLELPFELTLRELKLEDFALSNAAGDILLAIDRAALAGRWHERITLSQVGIESPQGAIRGRAALSLTRPFPAAATLELRYPLVVGGEAVPLEFSADVSGDLASLEVRLESADPSLVVEGRLQNVLDAPAWALEARSPALTWPLRAADPMLTANDVVVGSEGRASGYTLRGSGTLRALTDDAIRFELDGTGDARGIDIERLALAGLPLAVVAAGALEWADGFGVRVRSDVERFDPAAFTAAWPADMPLTGRVVGGFRPGQLDLEALEASVRGTDQAVRADGTVDLEGGVVDLDLEWTGLRWPLSGEAWRLRSATGAVTVRGRPEDWALDGSVALAAPELPPGRFELSGRGSREEATVVIEDSQVLGGRVAGKVDVARPGGGRWVASLSASGIDSGALLPEWPGRIDARLATSGRADPLELSVDVERLSGTLRGRPLEGSGGVRFAAGHLTVEDLELASGEARLRADGSLRTAAGVEFELDVPALAAVVPQAAGSLGARGMLSLARGFPRADIDLQGRELAWRDFRIGELELTASEGAEPLVVHVEAGALALGGVALDTLVADLGAGETRQRLALTASLGEREAELALDGRLDEWRRPLDSPWRGRLETLAVHRLMPGLGLALSAPAALQLGTERVVLERACLAAQEGPAGICVAGEHAGAGDFEISTELSAVPVGLIRLALDTELEFTQTLDGGFSLRSRPGRRLSADARIDITPGRIYQPANRRMNLDTRAGELRLDLDDGRVLFASLVLPVGTAASIDARFNVEDVRRGPDSPIGGRVLANVEDIGVLTALVPSLPRAGGRLGVDLALAGTLERPSVTGDASLANGALTYAPLGLELDDIELEGRIGNGNRIDLRSTFRAGEGTGRLFTSTNGLGTGESGVRLSLTGDELTIVNLPQLEAVADMNVGAWVSPKELVLNGWVRVPRARIAPRDIASGRVSESEDVVIVASDNGEEEVPPPPASPLAFRGRVGLTLGDDVSVDFDAAETRLSGSVAFDWSGPPLPTATGEYKVAGRFEAYGQLLEITEGSVRFPSVPANNPQLRIRAEREIFGNPQIRTAGVLVTGSAKDPEIEVYTNPETTEERALTLLVTGSDFDYEQGVGAVDVGTYIAPDLYLSYGIGLFDRENVISLRYDIARGFGIKVTSGKSTEGVDLSYTFER